MNIMLGIVAFGGAALVLVWAVSGQRQTANGATETNVHQRSLDSSGFQRLMLPILTKLGRHIARLLPPGRLQAMRRRIIHAGKQMTWNVEKAMALKAAGTIAGVAGALFILSQERTTMTMVLAALVAGIGYFGVDYYLDKAASARQLEIQQSLPDILDQISVCVEAGLGFDAALQRASQSNDNPLGDELGRTLQDIRLGVPRTQALHSLLDRTDVQDLRLFVRALVQAERSGIPIARVLQVQSDEVREKRRQAAEERAMRLPVMLIMPLVLCILPSLFTVIMGPAVLRMIREGAV
ncbi:MAG: type II secretion system F family protein [Actinomycetota bacterium]